MRQKVFEVFTLIFLTKTILQKQNQKIVNLIKKNFLGLEVNLDNLIKREKNSKNEKDLEESKADPADKKPDTKVNVFNSRAGGVYIPPFKLAKIYEDIKNQQDSKSQEYQKMMWEMLRKSVNGIINKVNVSNIQNVVYELFCENLVRGKGILVRAIIKAQMASPNFTHVYACLVAIINSKVNNFLDLFNAKYYFFNFIFLLNISCLILVI